MPLESIRIGSPFSRQYDFETSPGVPRDLTGSTFVWCIRGATGMQRFTAGITVDEPGGAVTVALTSAQTATLTPNNGAECYLEETIAGEAAAKAQTTERIIPAEASE